jgi:proline iminopeptidase
MLPHAVFFVILKAMKNLYPPIEPNQSGILPVGNLHALYWEESGTPDGVPIVFLHGGPGSGTTPWQRQFFNPEKYRIILFDQRGCGKSTPHGCLEENTTDDLLTDMEKLRAHLGVENWFVFGGSWGSTLALAYANSYPKKVNGLVLYGIFLCREQELIDTYFPEGIAAQIYPDIYEDFIALLSEKDKNNPIEGYHQLFLSEDETVRHKAIDMWTRWEKRISELQVDEKGMKKEMANSDFVLSHSLIENHYFRHNGFIDGDAILTGIGNKLTGKPIHIVQGRYDMVCPLKTAWELKHAIPHAELHISSKAGHTAKEPETTDIIIDILDNL